ncbi:CDGSH iron-sulfur domain-containing protein [Nocardia sp. CA-119907]|uniref:CDGSH iron-sulfur domain-containing protein n=1 Tax=Nocardia sp. CA-119907 TaxID=3239973 RepID=UPI003D974397
MCFVALQRGIRRSMTHKDPSHRDRRRITFVPGGPALVEGPVEMVTENGTVVTSDRFVVAMCMCRRSKAFPFCDTSHRKHARPDS